MSDLYISNTIVFKGFLRISVASWYFLGAEEGSCIVSTIETEHWLCRLPENNESPELLEKEAEQQKLFAADLAAETQK